MNEYCLKDIIRIKHGFAFDGEHISQDDNGVVLVTPGNFKIGGGFQEDKCKFYTGEIPSEYILDPGSYIVTMTDLSKNIDTLGYSAIVPDTQRVYLHNQRIGLIEFISNALDKKYIYYLLQTHQYQRTIANTSTGATVHHTSPSKICDYKFFAPDIKVQKKIVDILSAYDDLIENNRKQIKLLEEAAQRLYKEWFVDLRFPGHEHAKIVDGVPEGWARHNVNEVVTFHRGYDLTKENMQKGPYPVVGSTSVIGYHDKYKIAGPGIVTGRSGSLGQFQLIWENYWPHNTSLYVSDFKNHNIFYVFSLLQTLDFSALNNGGAIPTLNRNTLSNIEIIEPPARLQDEYSVIANYLYSEINIKQNEIKILEQARDRLLPKLMSGVVKV